MMAASTAMFRNSLSDSAYQEAAKVQTGKGNVIRFERLGFEEGLSQGCVNSILQDSQGFHWTGTQDSLNRYDGYTFTVYRHDSTDPASLSNNVIYAISEDAEGALWLGTERGLMRFDKRSEVFAPYRSAQQDGLGWRQAMIRPILEDSQAMLWIGTLGQGLYQIDRRTGQLITYWNDLIALRSLVSNNVTAL